MAYFAPSSLSERRLSQPKKSHQKRQKYGTDEPINLDGEAAKFLGIKVSYLHKLMMRRVIPYYKPNGKLCFFDKAELEAWMKNVRVASQSELDQQAQKYIINRSKR